MKNTSPILLLLTVSVSLSDGFHMIKVDPGLVSVQPGDTVSLLCAVDGHWEYCRFYTPTGEDCDFEWKRAVNGVRMQSCAIRERAEFNGIYDDKQCGITIKDVTTADSGVWVCHMEEYVFLGGRGSGRTVEAKINVTVQTTTTSPAPPSTTPIPTPGQPVPTTQPPTTTTTVDHHIKTNSQMEDAETVLPKKIAADNVPEAVPRIEEADSTTPVVIGVICAILLVGALIAGVLFFRRRQQTRDSSAAAVVYDREARAVHDQRSMVNGRRLSSEMSYRDSSGNYHEFFPPHLNVGGGASASPESQA